jgi:hypothetical protein
MLLPKSGPEEISVTLLSLTCLELMGMGCAHIYAGRNSGKYHLLG